MKEQGITEAHISGPCLIQVYGRIYLRLIRLKFFLLSLVYLFYVFKGNIKLCNIKNTSVVVLFVLCLGV